MSTIKYASIDEHIRQRLVSAGAHNVYIWDLSGKEFPHQIIQNSGAIQDISYYGDYIVIAESKVIRILRFSSARIVDNKALPMLTLPTRKLKKHLPYTSAYSDTSTIRNIELGYNENEDLMQLLVCDHGSVSYWTWKGEQPHSLSFSNRIVHGLDESSVTVYWASSQGKQHCIIFGREEGVTKIGVGVPNGGLEGITWTKANDLPCNLQLIDFSRDNGWLVLGHTKSELHDYRTVYIWAAIKGELIGCITDIAWKDAALLSTTESTASFVVFVSHNESQIIKRYFIDFDSPKRVALKEVWRYGNNSSKRTISKAEYSGSGAVAIPYTSRRNCGMMSWYSLIREPATNSPYTIPHSSRHQDDSDESEYSFVGERTINERQHEATNCNNHLKDTATIVRTWDSIDNTSDSTSIDTEESSDNLTDGNSISSIEDLNEEGEDSGAMERSDDSDDRESLPCIEDLDREGEDSGAMESSDYSEDRESLSCIEDLDEEGEDLETVESSDYSED